MNNIELDTLRLKIDDIDFQLSNLLKERQSLASKIMIAKKGNSHKFIFPISKLSKNRCGR